MGNSARIPNAVHEAQPWRLREIAPDFVLEDVWALPVSGDATDFARLPAAMAAGSKALGRESRVAMLLFGVRKVVGKLLGWDKELAEEPVAKPSAQPPPHSLAVTLPADLQPSADQDFGQVAPFRFLFATDNEWTAELANSTVHAVAQLTWNENGERYHGRLAVYVKPRGRMGAVYMAAIKPFRHAIVYPALLRAIGKAWRA